MSQPIHESLQLIKQTQQKVQVLLSGAEHNRNLLEINSLFERLKSRLVFMGGVLEPEKPQNDTKSQFPPITNFMGEEIKSEPKITQEDLNPDEHRKKIFLEKVSQLYKQITEIPPQSILNSYTLPEDVLVLRGVAKRAGVEGFGERPLNVAFIEDIILAIEMKNEEAGTLDRIDGQMQANKELNNPVLPGEQITDGGEAIIPDTPNPPSTNAKTRKQPPNT